MEPVAWVVALGLLIVFVVLGWRWVGWAGRRAPDQRESAAAEQRSQPRRDPADISEYAGLDPTYVLIGAPVVPGAAGDVPLREWLRHEHPTNDHVWRDVVAEFYDRAAQDPEIASYFGDVDVETLQRHFLATLLMVSNQGLTVGAVRQMRDRHTAVHNEQGQPITGPVFEKTVQVLLEVLGKYGVPPVTLTQVFAVLAPLRQAIVGQVRHA